MFKRVMTSRVRQVEWGDSPVVLKPVTCSLFAMRMSTLFGLTLREATSRVEVASHGLLLRAGFIRQLAAGIFSYLPLAKRSIGKIEMILREEMADGRYERLISAGVEVLYDDRRESLGAKFKDADLVGAPIRLTLTPRSLQRGGVEIKARSDAESSIVSTDEVVSVVKWKIADLETEVSPGDSIASVPRESPA